MALEGKSVDIVQDGVPFAHVRGVDLKRVSLSDRDPLRRLMETHAVLIFPDQDLTPQDEARVNRAFGYHDEEQKDFNFGFSGYAGHDASVPACPEVELQGNVYVKDHFGIDGVQLKMVLGLKEEGFHSDAVHDQNEFEKKELPVLTSMYALQVPESGGETYFACTRTDWRKVPEKKKAMLRRLRVHYLNSESLRLRGRPVMKGGVRRICREKDAELAAAGFDDLDAPRWAERGPVHPLVRKHPDTGEEAIFLSCGHLSYMEAPATDEDQPIFLNTDQSYDLVEELVGPACAPPVVYAHRWKLGDFVIWDNRICMHAPPVLDNIVGDRLFHRVRLGGAKAANVDCEAVWDEVLQRRVEEQQSKRHKVA